MAPVVGAGLAAYRDAVVHLPCPSSSGCLLGFGLTENQARRGKIGLRFEEAVAPPFFSKTFAIRFLKTGTRRVSARAV